MLGVWGLRGDDPRWFLGLLKYSSWGGERVKDPRWLGLPKNKLALEALMEADDNEGMGKEGVGVGGRRSLLVGFAKIIQGRGREGTGGGIRVWWNRVRRLSSGVAFVVQQFFVYVIVAPGGWASRNIIAGGGGGGEAGNILGGWISHSSRRGEKVGMFPGG